MMNEAERILVSTNPDNLNHDDVTELGRLISDNNLRVVAAGLDQLDTGMTDADLEFACADQPTGVARWVHWTVEIYSLGKCLRYWTGYPRYLPLFVYSDHGVGLHSHLFPHELANQAKVHFTWQPVKEQRHKNIDGKKVIQIIHPWISYRRLRGITRSKQPKGTLAFFMHGTTAVEWKGHDSEEYFEKLKNLPDKFQPVTLCLHMSDIKAGLHKKLRQYNFPIVTAGNTSASNFVDRYYDLVRNCSYATAPAWGSYAAYCVELGVPYFQLGERPVLENIADPNLPAGVAPQYWDSHHETLGKKAEELFRAPVDRVTDEQREFVESILGFDSRLTRGQVSWILWRELFRNWKQWQATSKFVLAAFLYKLGLMSKVKEIRQRFKSK